MRKRWVRAILFIWGLAPLILLVFAARGARHADSLFILWFLIWMLSAVVWGLLGFIFGIKEGYVEAERDYRKQTGRCAQCGYILRGNVSAVCPECGTPVAPRAKDRTTQ